jgi:Domain of unknown function (DUF4145)
MKIPYFIVDCPSCKVKVIAKEEGRAERLVRNFDLPPFELSGERIFVGSCQTCSTLLVGQSLQMEFAEFYPLEDRWSEVIRVYPKPTKRFSSDRIPRVVEHSLIEADRSLQASANTAACAMFGRALEAVCRDILQPKEGDKADEVAKKVVASKKKIMLAQGIKQLKDKNVIDDRLYDWSQQLHAFRNLAAHADDGEILISREDAEDLQAFVYAIIEYIYDLADRYDDFRTRIDKRTQQKKT